MEEEKTNDTATETTQTPEENEGKKKTWVWVAVGAVILLIIVGVIVATSQSDSVSGILKIVNVQPTTGTPTTTPTTVTTIPEEGDAIVTGTVSVKGVAPSGSTIGIARKSPSTGKWAVVVEDLLPRATDIPWTWATAVDGVTYEMQAVLLSSKDDLLHQSQTSKVKASATAVKFEIVVSELPPPPNGTLSVECVDRSTTNAKWRVSLTYNINNPNTDAQQYRLGIGTTPSADLILDTVTRPASPDTTQNYETDYIVDQGTEYHTAYAYATCTSCAEFSQASKWATFTCTEENAAGSPTPTEAAATTTSTPTPTQ